MLNVTVGPWTLEVDAEATKLVYEQIEQGAAAGCDCDFCYNFGLVRPQAYPAEARTLLESLGVDLRKECESFYAKKLPSGKHLYGGWFYVVGTIERGDPDSDEMFELVPGFQVRVAEADEDGTDRFGTRCVQVDFLTEVPWLSDRPEPE